MIDPVKARNWALALTAIIAVVGTVGTYGKRVIAQEAGETAQAIVNTHAEVAEARLGQLVNSDRRREDRELLDRCELRAERRGEEPLDFEQACAEESNLRWLWWDYDDCLIEKREGCVQPMRPRP